MRVSLNAGEVVVRAIGNDLHMDYSAVGGTTVLAQVEEQNPQSVRRNHFSGEQISREFLLLSEHRSASNYPGAAEEAASGKFESERFCADNRVTASCDVGCAYFCSSLLLETLICGP
jgi:hypothetical protein